MIDEATRALVKKRFVTSFAFLCASASLRENPPSLWQTALLARYPVARRGEEDTRAEAQRRGEMHRVVGQTPSWLIGEKAGEYATLLQSAALIPHGPCPEKAAVIARSSAFMRSSRLKAVLRTSQRRPFHQLWAKRSVMRTKHNTETGGGDSGQSVVALAG